MFKTTLARLPVTDIKFSDVVVTLDRVIFISLPLTSIKLAVPVVTDPTFTFASKVGVLIVIEPPAATAKLSTAVVTNGSPVIVIGAFPVTVSSPNEIVNS